MPSSITTIPSSERPVRDEQVVELGRLFDCARASRRDVALAATAVPGFADVLVKHVDALHRGANWRPDAECALARLGFRRAAELLVDFDPH